MIVRKTDNKYRQCKDKAIADEFYLPNRGKKLRLGMAIAIVVSLVE